MIEKMLISLFVLAIIVVTIFERKSLLIKEEAEKFMEKWENYNDPLWKGDK